MAIDNLDNITDEDVELILQQIDSGTFEVNPSGSENDNDDNLGNDGSEQTENLEDTEGDDLESNEAETNDQDDDFDDDTEEEEDNDNSANTQVENNQDDNGQNADTSTSEDANSAATGRIDPNEYARLKKFYDEIANAEFVANGKKVKAFTDPEKIIRSQQMLHGYSDRMKGFNEYRPFMKALKDKGLLEDESKFNFALSLLDGDKAAIKQHMKTLNIDPVDLELDETAYKPKNFVASPESIILEDTLQVARESGIEDKLRKTIGEQWDNESFKEFVSNPEVRQDLLEHMQSGAFDMVQDKIREMELLDTYGTFRNMKSTDKYRHAVQLVNQDLSRNKPSEPVNVQAQNANVQNKANNDIAAKEASYKAQVEQKNKEADEARKKAAALSKKKSAVVQTKKFDPLALEGDELDSFVDNLISGKLK